MSEKRAELMRLFNLTDDRLERRQLITPELAAKLLECNTNNRNINQSRLRLWKDAMFADRWDLTGDSITFDNKGVLTNGQHRLESIVETGKSVMCIVAADISFSLNTDIGAKRSNLQNMKLAGTVNEVLVNTNLVVQASNIVLAKYNHSVGNTVQSYVVEDFLNKYSNELVEMVDAGIFARSKLKGVFIAPVLAAFIIARLSEVDIVDLQHIRAVLKDGFVDYPYDKTIVALRNRLINDSLQTGNTANNKKLLLTLYALNCYRNKRSVKSVREGSLDDFSFKPNLN